MTVYQWVNDSPESLGHLIEGNDNRVISFAVARAAVLGDSESRKKALGQLHELRTNFGDINKHNFL